MISGSWSFWPEADSPKGDSPKVKDVCPDIKGVLPDVSKSMKIDNEILIFFLSDLPAMLSGDCTYTAPQLNLHCPTGQVTIKHSEIILLAVTL